MKFYYMKGVYYLKGVYYMKGVFCHILQAKLHKHLTSKLLRQNSITASISDIQSALIQDGRYFDTRYDVEQVTNCLLLVLYSKI